MDTIVTATIGGLVTSPITKIYFNGVQPRGSTNYLASYSATKLAGLKNGLIIFFGETLGCVNDPIFQYAGLPLNVIHQYMGVTNSAFDEFNKILLGVTAAAGVSIADNAVIATVLESTRPQIVITIPKDPAFIEPGSFDDPKKAAIIAMCIFAACTLGLLLATFAAYNTRFVFGSHISGGRFADDD